MKLHCKFSFFHIRKAVARHDTLIQTHTPTAKKKNSSKKEKKIKGNVHLTTIERDIEISLFFLRKLIRKSCCEREWRSFFLLFFFNERLNEEITSTVSEFFAFRIVMGERKSLFLIWTHNSLYVYARAKNAFFHLKSCFNVIFPTYWRNNIMRYCYFTRKTDWNVLCWKCTTGSFAKSLFVFHSPGLQTSAVPKTNKPQIYDNK